MISGHQRGDHQVLEPEIVSGPGSQQSEVALTEPNAVVALVMAVGSFILPLVSIPFLVIPSFVLAVKAKRRIRASQGTFTGRQLATIAQVVAVTHIVVVVGVLWALAALLHWAF